MDIFLANDFYNQSEFLSAEMCEYLPKGEGWQYTKEGRIAYDGDRPINTNGGRCQYGHAAGASGLHDVYEAVHQMRGDAGATHLQIWWEWAVRRFFPLSVEGKMTGKQNIFLETAWCCF